jgi:hypothetical protein
MPLLTHIVSVEKPQPLKIAAGNAGWSFQFVEKSPIDGNHRPRISELWLLGHTTTYNFTQRPF